jgi:hypothetical protein
VAKYLQRSCPIHGEVDVSLKDPIHEIDDYIICFDAYDKSALPASLQSIVSAALIALRIGGGREYEFENVGNGSYLCTNDGKIVHSFSLKPGASNAWISSPLENEQVTQIASDLRLILRSGDLERLMRLHAHSLDCSTDNFRAFISAWTALEILLGKVFPIYHQKLAAELAKVSAAPGFHAYLDRIDDVMDDKHNLTDKFAVVSMFLDDQKNEKEIELFRGLKKIRDRLSHGDAIPEETLPTKQVQRLFEKYFRNHVRKSA